MWSPLARRHLPTTFYGLHFNHLIHSYKLQIHGGPLCTASMYCSIHLYPIPALYIIPPPFQSNLFQLWAKIITKNLNTSCFLVSAKMKMKTQNKFSEHLTEVIVLPAF